MMSEHKLRFPVEVTTHNRALLRAESSQWGGRRHLLRGRGGRGTVVMKTGEEEEEEGTVSLDKASAGPDQHCKLQYDYPPTMGS